jgi:hypothetical protein
MRSKEAPMAWARSHDDPPRSTAAPSACGREDHELDPALEHLVKQEQWLDDFIERLNYTNRGYRS